MLFADEHILFLSIIFFDLTWYSVLYFLTITEHMVAFTELDDIM